MLRSFVYILYVIYKLGHLALRGKITIDCGAVRQIDRSVDNAVKAKPKQWVITDWPDLTKMAVFNKKEEVDPYLQTR